MSDDDWGMFWACACAWLLGACCVVYYVLTECRRAPTWSAVAAAWPSHWVWVWCGFGVGAYFLCRGLPKHTRSALMVRHAPYTRTPARAPYTHTPARAPTANTRPAHALYGQHTPSAAPLQQYTPSLRSRRARIPVQPVALNPRSIGPLAGFIWSSSWLVICTRHAQAMYLRCRGVSANGGEPCRCQRGAVSTPSVAVSTVATAQPQHCAHPPTPLGEVRVHPSLFHDGVLPCFTTREGGAGASRARAWMGSSAGVYVGGVYKNVL